VSRPAAADIALAAAATRLRAHPDADGAPVLAHAASPSLAPDDAKDLRGALILGGAHGTLAIARSLGRHGIPVWFISHENLIPRFSRYVSRNLLWRGPDHPNAAAELLDIARRNDLKGWVLIPGGDPEVGFVSQHRDALSSVFLVTTPPWEQMKWTYDKHLTYDRAASLGIGYPLSYYPRDHYDVVELDCRFPLILKPTVRERKNAFTREKAWRVDDRAALLSRYDEAVAMVGADAIVLQELIPGRGSAQFSYAAVWDRGKPVASLVAQRLRQLPIDFGYTSTFVRTIENKDVEVAAVRFLTSINYSGLVEVEFKYDTRDGQYKILDVNARSWTWIALGGLAGVDFPAILWRIATGEQVTPMRGQPGATWMLSSRDIVAACREMLAGSLSVSGYLRSLRAKTVFAAFAADDPLPGIVELPLVIARQLGRRLSELMGTSAAS
jgi:D-aspartate ligase